MHPLRLIRRKTIEPAYGQTGGGPVIGRIVHKDVLQYRPARIDACPVIGTARLVYSDEWVDVPVIQDSTTR